MLSLSLGCRFISHISLISQIIIAVTHIFMCALRVWQGIYVVHIESILAELEP